MSDKEPFEALTGIAKQTAGSEFRTAYEMVSVRDGLAACDCGRGCETYRSKIPRRVYLYLARCWRRLLLAAPGLRRGILASMGAGGAVLSIVQSGAIWRVRIAWPNCPARYFGKFNSETEAQEWITAHDSLTKPPSRPFVESPPIISDPNASRE